MKDELRFGSFRYISFVLLDVVCLLAANYLAVLIYLARNTGVKYSFLNHYPATLLMIVIDLGVTAYFNTLSRVLRRRKRFEGIAAVKHVGISFVVFAVVLFSIRRGAAYSRLVVFLTYAIYFLLFIGTHIAWKSVLQKFYKKTGNETAILMTTDRFVDEGLEELNELQIDVKNIFLLMNLNKDEIHNIPVVKDWEEAASAICWKMLDKVYIYGLDHQMVPNNLVKACREMKLDFHLVDFNYRIIDVKTIQNEDPKYGVLSFLEGKRDIPFPIRRVYWITETEADLHRGFHAHKLNCQLLYCPYGVIDIILDDGLKRTTVTLDRPGKGLILMPGLWREMIWRQSGSVLCVLASEYYDAEEYIRNYDEFIAYNKRYREGH